MTTDIIKLPKEFTQKIVIKSAEHLTNATELLSKLNSKLKEITADKKSITDPIKQSLKEIESRYKQAETILTENIVSIRMEMSKYQTNQLKKESAIISKLESGKIGQTSAMNKIEALATDVRVETGSGTLKFRADEKCEVEDITKVPMEYLIPDQVKINKAMKAGIKLPGVRYYTVQVPINRI
jgi:hypothetical protein